MNTHNLVYSLISFIICKTQNIKLFTFKNKLLLAATFINLICISDLSAQQTDYKISLEGGSQLNANTFQFDIYINSTGEDFVLTSYQCSFTFNTDITDNGTLTFNYVNNTSQLINKPIFAIGIENSSEPKLRFASGVGKDTITSKAKKIGKFRLINSKPFANEFPEIRWCFVAPSNTIITGNSFDNITDPIQHNDLVYSSPLPVELSSFSSNIIENNVSLKWETKSEINNFGFDIERSINSENFNWEKIGFISGNGNSLETIKYEFIDKNPLKNQSTSYRLKQINFDNSFSYSDVINVGIIPGEFKLYQNYPNPFNPTTTIKYSLPFESNVRIIIFNPLGEAVTNLFEGLSYTGNYELQWNAEDFAGGVYIASFSAVSIDGTKKYSSVKKMLLVK